MALTHSPKIVTNNLVFYYDSGNRNHSWLKNKNLAKTASGTIDWSIGNLTGAVSRSTVITDERYRITCSTGGSFRFYFNLSNLSNGGTYTLSFKFKYNNASNTNFTLTDWCDTSISSGTAHLGDGVYFHYGTGTRSTYDSTYRFMDANIDSGQEIEVWDFQLEKGDTPTGYSEILNTAGLLDLTNNYSPSLVNPSIDSLGNLTFDGSNTYIDISSIDFSSAQTIEIWLKPTENDSVRRNPYDQAYGGYGTWTHEPSGVINYYYGDSGTNGSPYIGHTSSFTVDQNEVACVCTTRNTSISWWYKNGEQYNSYSHGFGTLAATSAGIRIGRGYAGSYLGYIYAVKLYNRALTSGEVRQNFNALRGRFGI